MDLGNGVSVGSLSLPEVDLIKLQSRLQTGNAILFTGAGFSLGTENTLGKEPPLAKGLSKKISKLAGIDEDEDLKYTANVYLKYNSNPSPLLSLLKDNFILKSVSDYHKTIVSNGWKRFYTTNYDNSIELAGHQSGIRVESVDLTYTTSDFVKNDNLCIHLNGFIDKAVVDDLKDKIKLSNSSYLSPDSFLDSNWRTIFKRDLETSSAIIFAGYSLYDFDVQKLLFELPHLKDKTYFITHEGASHKDTFEISQFGHVLPIGIDKFADIISKIERDSTELTLMPEPEAFILKTISSVDDLVEADTTKLLLYGDYKQAQIDTAISKNFTIPYIFNRKAIDEASSLLFKNKNVFIHSDLGNGKTVFLDILASYLTTNGTKTYILENDEADYLQDIDIISKMRGDFVLIIDNYTKYENILNYYSSIKPDNITLLLSDRNAESLRLTSDLEKLEIKIHAIGLDLLNDTEIDDLINIINDQGSWSEFTGLSHSKKHLKIKNSYNSQLSGVLLGLLKSPQISQKITELTVSIFENPPFKRTLFSIAICDILGVNKKSDIISDMAGNDAIYDIDFRTDTSFKSFYRFSSNDSQIETRSSLLSLFLINYCFSETYVKNECLRIVSDFIDTHGSDIVKIKIYKSLLRYHVIEKLMPHKKATINNYYMEIKREVSRLTEHPHYWVQYAMCKLEYNDEVLSQRFLDNAYELAAKRKSYHTDNIDTQQARLFIIMCLKTKDALEAYNYFSKTNTLLSSLPNDGFKFRQVISYGEIYDKKYNYFSKRQKVEFEYACNALSEIIFKMNEEDIHIIKRGDYVVKAEEILIKITTEIKDARIKK
ncbi:SIR2 family protein [Pseudocolwellia sp. HL-MZ7]|uniref:SIR2 family protein n=1 Tax=Pseudocolwellia sp. HL-MZ7 TaxID=3400627 RepID=UPI003CF3EB1B